MSKQAQIVIRIPIELQKRINKSIEKIIKEAYCSECGRLKTKTTKSSILRKVILEWLEKEEIRKCTDKNPCCNRRNEYNGLSSDGPLKFVCPNHCSCHD
ncbi:MAG: hypothetical protein ACTSW7_01520 [Candidatus Thorarchaeota archaeon]|nr:hypothetical protein [Thermoplasmatales archaeon]